MQTVTIDIALLHKMLYENARRADGGNIIKLDTLLLIIAKSIESASEEQQ